MNRIVQIKKRASILSALLTTYSKYVKIYGYKRIPYSDWSKMSEAACSNGDFIATTKSCQDSPSVNFIFEDTSIRNVLIENNADFFRFFLEYFDTEIKNMQIQFDASKPVNKNKEENKIMKNFNFDFGPCSGNDIRMSMYGLAIKNATGTWVSYNPADESIVDVDVMNFDGGRFMFKMPVAIKDIAAGDIIVHNKVPMFVNESDGARVVAVDVRAGEEKIIIPTTNMFGFNFITKIVSLFNAMGNAPTPEAPFGNMLPFMLMNDEDGSDSDMMPMMMAMMMGNGGGTGAFDMSNPMLMYMMMKDGDSSMSKMLPMMMLMGGKQ